MTAWMFEQVNLYRVELAWENELARLDGLAAQFDPVSIRQLAALMVGRPQP
jgi:hypothetical protein